MLNVKLDHLFLILLYLKQNADLLSPGTLISCKITLIFCFTHIVPLECVPETILGQYTMPSQDMPHRNDRQRRLRRAMTKTEHDQS